MHYPTDTIAGRRVAERAFPLMMMCPRIAGTQALDADGLPVNQLMDAAGAAVQIAGQPVYANGWLACARREWEAPPIASYDRNNVVSANDKL